MRLKEKVAIITGAGAGIGRGIAERFAREGAAVVVADNDRVAGESAVQAIRAIGGEAVFLATDVSREDQIKAMVDQTLNRYKRMDILCKNAAVLFFREEAPAHELSNDTWDRTMAVNLRGYWLTSKYVIPVMLRQGSGSIIHVASPCGIFGFTRLTAYSASKGSVIGLMRGMAADYAPHHIRVNAIIPGTIDTPMNAIELSEPATRAKYARNCAGTPFGKTRRYCGNRCIPGFERLRLLRGRDLHCRRWTYGSLIRTCRLPTL